MKRKGHPAWNKGKKDVYTKDALKRMSDKRKGTANAFKTGKTIDKRGYILIYAPWHPYKAMRSYVREHRLVMEAYIGRYLTVEEVVHHIDGNKQNNHITNLMLFKNHSEHKKYEGKN